MWLMGCFFVTFWQVEKSSAHTCEFTIGTCTVYSHVEAPHVWRLLTCGGDIHLWNIHINSCVEHAGSIHMWRLRMFRDIHVWNIHMNSHVECAGSSHIHVWNVHIHRHIWSSLWLECSGFIGSSRVEGTFTSGTYMWIHMWNVEGLFPCRGSSHVEGRATKVKFFTPWYFVHLDVICLFRNS